MFRTQILDFRQPQESVRELSNPSAITTSYVFRQGTLLGLVMLLCWIQISVVRSNVYSLFASTIYS